MHKLRIFGLALIAVLAMSAMVASAAQGQAKFTIEKVGATVEGEQIEGLHSFTTTHGTVNCTGAIFHGVGAALETTEQDLTATYSGCKFAGLNAVVEMTGCFFRFTAGNTTTPNDPNTISPTIHILCPPEKKIDIKVIGSECEVTVGPQTIENGIILHNAGKAIPSNEMDIRATLNITGITYTVHKPIKCPNPGGSETVLRHNATLTGKATIKAKNAQGPVGITVH